MAVISRIKGMLMLDISEGKTQRQSNYIFTLVVADVHGLNCWIWINFGPDDATAETKTLDFSFWSV